MPGEMTQNTKRLFLIFKDAVQRERDAQILYKQAAALCDDKALKELLMSFHKDETRHEKALVQRYNRLRKKYNVSEG